MECDTGDSDESFALKATQQSTLAPCKDVHPKTEAWENTFVKENQSATNRDGMLLPILCIIRASGESK
jgi:hypothetical protein